MRCSRWSSLALSALSALALSPPAHGARLAVDTQAGIATLAGDGSGRAVVPGLRGFSGPSWSPDGTRLVVEGTRLVGGTEARRLFFADSGQVTEVPGSDGLSSPAWAPDGASIAASRNGSIVVLPAAGGAARVISAGPAD